jgi:hypothetical protein
MSNFAEWLRQNCGWKEYRIINPKDCINLTECEAIENINNYINGYLITKERIYQYVSKKYPGLDSLFLKELKEEGVEKMGSVNEVDLPVLMSMVKDKLENPDRAWFLEVKLSAREWEKLVKCYYNKEKGV